MLIYLIKSCNSFLIFIYLIKSSWLGEFIWGFTLQLEFHLPKKNFSKKLILGLDNYGLKD